MRANPTDVEAIKTAIRVCRCEAESVQVANLAYSRLHTLNHSAKLSSFPPVLKGENIPNSEVYAHLIIYLYPSRHDHRSYIFYNMESRLDSVVKFNCYFSTVYYDSAAHLSQCRSDGQGRTEPSNVNRIAGLNELCAVVGIDCIIPVRARACERS